MKMNSLVWLLLLLNVIAEQVALPVSVSSLRITNAFSGCFDDLLVDLDAGVTNKTSRDEPFELSKISAENGDIIAQYRVAHCYEFGFGTSQDIEAAVKWYLKVAKQADKKDSKKLDSYFTFAERHLAVCYDRAGKYTEAAKWYLKAAERGDAIAQNNLAAIYRDGLGHYHDGLGVIDKSVYRSYPKAVHWFQKGANQELWEAQFNLSWCFARGEGVPQDFVEAYKWASLAATEGNTNAVYLRGLLRQDMTPEQVAEGQLLSRDFKAGKAKRSGASASHKEVPESQPSASGTGVFISDDGFLITNEHVVRDAAQVRLVTSTGLISAKVVKVDAANDLALLKAEGKFSSLPVATSRGVKLGGTVATVGFPNIGLQGFAPKLAKGEIASLSGAGDDARYFQISVPVQPGNSGGALVDERGNVVGVVAAKLSASAALKATGSLPENVNYAVKSSYLLSFLESVPEVSAKLKEPETKERKFEDVVKSAEQAAVLVLVY